MFIFDAPPQISVPFDTGSFNFPVRRIFCVGQNYADHAREMGADGRAPPFFFCKPADAIVLPGIEGGCRIPYPQATQELHHEVELVAAIGPRQQSLATHDTDVMGFAIGLDLTRRDLQKGAKALGQPWDMAKGFDHSAPVSVIRPIESCGTMKQGAIRFWVNDELRQAGDLSQMIWPVEDIVAELKKLVTLRPGDLIFTGTPAGVGPLVRGDRFKAEIEHLGALSGAVF